MKMGASGAVPFKPGGSRGCAWLHAGGGGLKHLRWSKMMTETAVRRPRSRASGAETDDRKGKGSNPEVGADGSLAGGLGSKEGWRSSSSRSRGRRLGVSLSWEEVGSRDPNPGVCRGSLWTQELRGSRTRPQAERSLGRHQVLETGAESLGAAMESRAGSSSFESRHSQLISSGTHPKNWFWLREALDAREVAYGK